MSGSEPKAHDKEHDAQQGPNLLNHEYDGILEYDNPMPKWWLWIFWGTFYFSIGYYVHFQLTGNGLSVAQAFEEDVAQAREREASHALGGGVTEQSLTELSHNKAILGDAARLFALRCATCHGPQGEGLIGPNLTDGYWLHGDASLMSIYGIISEGVQSKGMPPWNRQLKPIELAKLAAFVGSIRNTNVAGPKGQEGTLVGPGTAPEPNAAPAEAKPVAPIPSTEPAK
jgi:cytochrome c oxidase cbb3-type subunit III